ncbi:MAG: DUF882 domain-containing protein [Polyangiaceae bacterium]
MSAEAKPHARAKAAAENDGEKTHTVAKGQTLRTIAKRYRISIDELREANDIKPGQRLAIGTKLTIPAPEPKASKKDKDRDEDRDTKKKHGKNKDKDRDDDSDADRDDDRDRDDADEDREVEKPSKKSKGKKDRDADRDDEKPSKKGKGKKASKDSKDDDEDRSPKDKPAKKDTHKKDKGKSKDKERDDSAENEDSTGPGSIRLVHLGEVWQGKVQDRKGKVAPEALNGFAKLLKFTPNGAKHTIEPRLVRLVGQVSQHFDGRTIEVVSGFRPYSPKQYTPHSKHNLGAALDFRVRGVRNEELRDFCKSLKSVGVGYYPNSSFVHLDVRPASTYWADYSHPGEAPRYHRNAPAPNGDARSRCTHRGRYRSKLWREWVRLDPFTV